MITKNEMVYDELATKSYINRELKKLEEEKTKTLNEYNNVKNELISF